MGLGQKCLDLELENPRFSIFSFRFKEISLGWVKNTWAKDSVVLLFTADQKYTLLVSGKGPSLV